MEKDLFEPIRAYFEGYGYACDGEVGGIDLYMEKDGKSVAVELKNTLDFRVLQQAALRQKVTETVFIGIPRPRDLYSRAFRDKIYLLKRLGIGLITVAMTTGTVEIVSEPVESDPAEYRKRNAKKRNALAAEFRRRTLKNNTGGVHGTPLMTGYREDALRVLDTLNELGEATGSRKVRKVCGVEKTAAILRDNHYGWFDRGEDGSCTVSAAGSLALAEYAEAIAMLRERTENIKSTAEGLKEKP